METPDTGSDMSGAIAIACLTFDLTDSKRAAQFSAFLASVGQLDSSVPRFRLFVVDSVASNVTREILEAQSPIPYSYEGHQENTGYGRGNAILLNQVASEGIERALFCNPDTVLRSSSIGDLEQAMLSSPDVAISFGPYEDGNGRVVPLLDSRFSLLMILSRRFSRKPTQHPLLTGCCFLADTDKLMNAGGFPEHFFLYGEEVELHRRVERAGFRSMLIRRITCEHWNGLNDADLLDPVWPLAKANSFRLLVTGNDPLRLAFPLVAAADGIATHRFASWRTIPSETEEMVKALRCLFRLCRRVSRNPEDSFTASDLRNNRQGLTHLF